MSARRQLPLGDAPPYRRYRKECRFQLLLVHPNGHIRSLLQKAQYLQGSDSLKGRRLNEHKVSETYEDVQAASMIYMQMTYDDVRYFSVAVAGA